MVSYYQKFRLLTWKYFSYRKFYWYWTLLELALPIILIYILVKVAESVIDVSEIRQPPTKTTPSNLSKIVSYENFDTIYYTPRNNISLAIMSRLSALLEKHEKKPAIVNVENEAELVLRLSQSQGEVIGIVFLSTDILSHVFKYKIRHKSVWNTSDLYVGDEIQQSGPYDPDPYLTSGFVAVQYYTDFAYLLYRIQSNGVDAEDNTSVNNITVNFQPFPYPEYTKATTSRNMIPIVIAFSIIVASLIMLCPLIFVITIERSRGIMYKVSGANKGITKATGTNADEEKYVDDEQSKLLFQDGPPGGEAILSFKNLHKRFGSIHAVNGINLNLYRNEILTLAGLEKSGKTTTLHLALGLIEPTEGTVTYKQSLNLLKSIDEHRSQLGFCPQENRLLPYFTILDHLVFYGMLRGEDELEATKKAISYLYLIGIAGNGNEYSSIITKEIERKTSIIIALIGNTEIVLLDEPVTGLELAAKQSIWNFLKKLKQTRTIFMTSTTMMDASLISDRIAVINNGIIVCSGSSEFLSKAFKVGYELKIRKSVVPTPIEPPTESSVGRPRRTKAPPKNGQTQTQVSLPRDTSNLIIQQIRRVFPGKRVIKSTKEIVINLPTFQTSKLPDLFKSLEDRKMELNIETIGVNCFTLENVFQKIGGETIFDIHGKPFKFSSIIQEALKITRVRHEKIKGIALLIDQHGILFKKKFLFVFRSWVLFLYRVVLPTLIMTVLIYGTYRFEEIDFPIELSLSSYPKSIIFLRENDYSNDIYDEVILFLTLSNTTFSITPNIDHNEVLLNYGRYNINTFRRDLLLALDLNIGDNQITVFYNKYARHSLPVGVNLFTNAMLKSYFDYSFEIITINHPISNVDVDKETDKFNTNVTDHSPVLTVWYIVLAFFTIDLLDYITIPIRDEHNSGFKHVQFLSGLSPLTYWINTLIFDFFLASLIVIFRVAIFHIFDAYGFFTFRIDLLVSATLVIVYIIAGLLFEYWISFIMPTKIGGLIVFKIVKFISKYLPSVGGNLSAGKLIAGKS